MGRPMLPVPTNPTFIILALPQAADSRACSTAAATPPVSPTPAASWPGIEHPFARPVKALGHTRPHPLARRGR